MQLLGWLVVPLAGLVALLGPGCHAAGTEQLLIAYTGYLQSLRHYDTFVVYRVSGLLLAGDLELQLQRSYGVPLVTLNGERQLTLSRTLGWNALAFVLLPQSHHFRSNQTDFGLRGRHNIPMTFAVATRPSEWDLLVFFRWCWHLNILNAILVYHVDGTDFVYGYTPFPKMTLIDLTAQRFERYHSDKVANMHGYRFDMQVFSDPPNVFQVGNETNGISGLVFREYAAQRNATYNIKRLEFDSRAEEAREQTIILGPSRKQTPLSINPVMSVEDFAHETAMTYPVALTRACIIVPVVPQAPKSYYLPPVFKIFTLPFLGITLLVVVYLHTLLNCTQSHRYGRIDFGLFLINFVNSALNQAIVTAQHMSRGHRLILATVGIFGFIWSNSVVATLTALLSSCMPGKQIESVQDFLDSGLPILSQDYDRHLYFESGLLPRVLLPRLHMTDITVLWVARATLNTTYAYVTTSAKWRHVNFLQHRLWRPRFRIASAELCSAMIPETWAIQHDSPFQESLTLHIMRLRDHGFMDQFRLLAGIKFGMLKLLFKDDYEEIVLPLTVQHLQLAFCLYAACIGLCCLVFLCELLVQNIKTKLRRQRLAGAA